MTTEQRWREWWLGQEHLADACRCPGTQVEVAAGLRNRRLVCGGCAHRPHPNFCDYGHLNAPNDQRDPCCVGAEKPWREMAPAEWLARVKQSPYVLEDPMTEESWRRHWRFMGFAENEVQIQLLRRRHLIERGEGLQEAWKKASAGIKMIELPADAAKDPKQ